MIKTNLFLSKCSAKDFSIDLKKKRKRKRKARLKSTPPEYQFDKKNYFIGRKLPI